MKKYIAYSSLWIALAAYLLVIATFSSANKTINWLEPLALFTFGDTLFIYSLHNYIKSLKNNNSDRNNWNKINKNHILIYGTLGIAIASVCMFQIRHETLVYYFLLGVCSVLYSSLILYKYSTITLKRIYGWIKPFYLASIWWIITFCIPLVEYPNDLNERIIVDGIFRLVVLCCVCILFDLKDSHHDKKLGIITIAQRYEHSIVANINTILTITQSIIFVYYIYSKLNLLIILIILCHWIKNLFKSATKYNDELFYVFKIDGILICYALIIIFYNQINN